MLASVGLSADVFEGYGFDSINIGTFFRHNGGPGDPTYNVDLRLFRGEIYADSTQARIEIGDAAVWEECTEREVQVPTAWTPTEITFTVHQGAIPSAAERFLFIVRSNGTASKGFPITFD